MLKKKNNLKSSQRKRIHNIKRGVSLIMTVYFLLEMTQIRRHQCNFTVLKENDCQQFLSRLKYLSKQNEDLFMYTKTEIVIPQRPVV